MQGEKITYKAFLLYNLYLWCAINKIRLAWDILKKLDLRNSII